MAERIEVFKFTIADGTLDTAPVDNDIDMADGEVERFEILIPRGHAGLTGFAFVYSGTQVIPKNSGFIVGGDSETIVWPVAGFPTGRKWVFRAFNEDLFLHSFYLRVLVNETRAPARTGAIIVPVG